MKRVTGNKNNATMNLRALRKKFLFDPTCLLPSVVLCCRENAKEYRTIE